MSGRGPTITRIEALGAAAIGSLLGYYIFSNHLKDASVRRKFEENFKKGSAKVEKPPLSGSP